MQNWIDAALELPEEMDEEASDDVLTFNEDGTQLVAFFDFTDRSWCERSGMPVNGVTHWQPLGEGPVRS